jgi:hypothetical protein
VAALTITATQVVPGTGATITRYTAGSGQTFTAGMTVYDQGFHVAGIADADGSAASAVCVGIALNGASPGQPVDVLEAGLITLGAGAAPAEGTPYFLSPTAGGISPLADVLSADYLVYLGMGIGSNQLSVQIHNTGAQVP